MESFVRQIEQISIEDRILLQTVARVIIKDTNGTLPEQLNRRSLRDVRVQPLSPTKSRSPESNSGPAQQRGDLIFFNGLGGFTTDGREYVDQHCSQTRHSTAAGECAGKSLFRYRHIGKWAFVHMA